MDGFAAAGTNLAKVGALGAGAASFTQRYAADDDTPKRLATSLTRAPPAQTSSISFALCSAVYFLRMPSCQAPQSSLPDGLGAAVTLLRGGQLGAVFRRQVPLLGFCIVDFLATGAKLVVEVDGPYHAAATRRRADARRDRRLSRAGYRVLRLTAEEVLGQPECALARDVAALAESAA